MTLGFNNDTNSLVSFEALLDAQTNEDRKNGGRRQHGLPGQDQCNRFVETGQDSR